MTFGSGLRGCLNCTHLEIKGTGGADGKLSMWLGEDEVGQNEEGAHLEAPVILNHGNRYKPYDYILIFLVISQALGKVWSHVYM